MIIPDGVELSRDIFMYRFIENVEIGAVEEIPDEMFYAAEIQNLSISEGVKRIGELAFAGDFHGQYTLPTVTIPHSVEEFGEWIFYNRKINILIVKSEIISEAAFSQMGRQSGIVPIETLIIEDTVRRIEAEAFYDNQIYHKLVIPNSIEHIGDLAFARNDLAIIEFQHNPEQLDALDIHIGWDGWYSGWDGDHEETAWETGTGEMYYFIQVEEAFLEYYENHEVFGHEEADYYDISPISQG